jgi:hypothetical protein
MGVEEILDVGATSDIVGLAVTEDDATTLFREGFQCVTGYLSPGVVCEGQFHGHYCLTQAAIQRPCAECVAVG